MIAKRHRRVVVVPTVEPIAPTKPLEPPEAPRAEYWLRSILTDRDGQFDAGAMLTVVVVIYMCIISGYSTMTLHLPFDPQSFGTGIGACLVGLAAYRWGDRPRHGMTTTTVRTDSMSSRKIDAPMD